MDDLMRSPFYFCYATPTNLKYFKNFPKQSLFALKLKKFFFLEKLQLVTTLTHHLFAFDF